MGFCGQSEFQRGCLGRYFHALLAARADQLYLNFLGGREGFEQGRQVQVLQRTRGGAGELVVSMDFTVLAVVFVAMLILVMIIVGRCVDRKSTRLNSSH